jgi:hypothetical protein
MARDSSLLGAKCAACENCPSDGCPAEHQDDVAALRGWRLGLTSFALFLLPVMLAIGGAACAGERGAAQLLGGLTGLALGICGAIATARLLGRSRIESP